MFLERGQGDWGSKAHGPLIVNEKQASCILRLGYTPYEGPSLANHIKRKVGVFDRKFKGSHMHFYIEIC